ncbi:MAG TPA: arsenate reductase ArsC, partial [Longimicrobiales bacterium]|nr:arsenate reductase ArsC [Longimicrobiales bacterium]
TVRVGGTDLEGPGPGAPALACRIYGDEGSPPAWMIEAALLRALAPRHFLFLCVANSARSQMAEGIARSVAPPGVQISSAGSAPASVRPMAVEALAEIGIDIRGQRSKGVDRVRSPVDAVITLCAEEVCPVWLEDSLRVHWPLPDPAGSGSSEAEELEAFRKVRDELRRRLARLFPD